MLGEAVSLNKTGVEELVGDSAEVSKLDRTVGSTDLDKSRLPYVVK